MPTSDAAFLPDADTRCARHPSALSSVEDGRVAIMQIEHGTYFDLEDEGAVIWGLLEEPVRFADLCAALGEQFDADAAEIEADTARFLAQLADESLVMLGQSV